MRARRVIIPSALRIDQARLRGTPAWHRVAPLARALKARRNVKKPEPIARQGRSEPRVSKDTKQGFSYALRSSLLFLFASSASFRQSHAHRSQAPLPRIECIPGSVRGIVRFASKAVCVGPYSHSRPRAMELSHKVIVGSYIFRRGSLRAAASTGGCALNLSRSTNLSIDHNIWSAGTCRSSKNS
jgi:hypothetical protein